MHNFTFTASAIKVWVPLTLSLSPLVLYDNISDILYYCVHKMLHDHQFCAQVNAYIHLLY